ncbi:MAG: hypothetical protein V5A45_07460 [Haloarculaceae archaeon]
MDRRKFLRRSSALGAITLAGCMADANDNANTGNGTPTPDESESDDISIVDSSVERTDSGCSSGEDPTATVSIDPESNAVTFSGHVVTGTPCHDIELSRATYNHDDGRLTVDLGTERADKTCVDCVGRIDFDGTVDLDGGVPSRVVVSHDDAVLADTGDEDGMTGPSIVDSTIELVDSGCSSGEDQTASVSMNESETTVSFSGLVTASDPCHEPTLERTEYDSATDRLAIVVGTESTADACDDCIGSIEFAGTVEFEGGLPSEASVGHGDTILSGGEATPDDPPELQASSFSVTSVESSRPRQTADASFDTDAETVTVTGTIVGNDGCMTAELGTVEYDAENSQLAVDVVTIERGDTGDNACTQQMVGIDYEATFSFDGGTPSSVAVSHDGDGIMAAGHGTSSASAPDTDT